MPYTPHDFKLYVLPPIPKGGWLYEIRIRRGLPTDGSSGYFAAAADTLLLDASTRVLSDKAFGKIVKAFNNEDGLMTGDGVDLNLLDPFAYSGVSNGVQITEDLRQYKKSLGWNMFERDGSIKVYTVWITKRRRITKGVYSGATTYAIGDIVADANNMPWKCLTAGSGHALVEGANWTRAYNIFFGGDFGATDISWPGTGVVNPFTSGEIVRRNIQWKARPGIERFKTTYVGDLIGGPLSTYSNAIAGYTPITAADCARTTNDYPFYVGLSTKDDASPDYLGIAQLGIVNLGGGWTPCIHGDTVTPAVNFVEMAAYYRYDASQYDSTFPHGVWGITTATVISKMAQAVGMGFNANTDLTSAFVFYPQSYNETTKSFICGSQQVTGDVQTVTITGAPTGGTFTLSFRGYTSSAIAYNATASTVQTALQAMTSIGTGNVTCSGTLAGGMTCTFGGTLAAPLPAMTVSAALTGGTSPAASVTTNSNTSQQILPKNLVECYNTLFSVNWSNALSATIAAPFAAEAEMQNSFGFAWNTPLTELIKQYCWDLGARAFYSIDQGTSTAETGRLHLRILSRRDSQGTVPSSLKMKKNFKREPPAVAKQLVEVSNKGADGAMQCPPKVSNFDQSIQIKLAHRVHAFGQINKAAGNAITFTIDDLTFDSKKAIVDQDHYSRMYDANATNKVWSDGWATGAHWFEMEQLNPTQHPIIGPVALDGAAVGAGGATGHWAGFYGIGVVTENTSSIADLSKRRNNLYGPAQFYARELILTERPWSRECKGIASYAGDLDTFGPGMEASWPANDGTIANVGNSATMTTFRANSVEIDILGNTVAFKFIRKPDYTAFDDLPAFLDTGSSGNTGSTAGGTTGSSSAPTNTTVPVGALVETPAVAVTNTVTPSADIVAMTHKAKTGQTASFEEYRSSTGTLLTNVSVDGKIHMPATVGGDSSDTATSKGYVDAAVASVTSPVSSVFGRTGAIAATSGDYSFSQISGTATVLQGGTGNTTYTNGQLLIGNTTGSTLTKATLTAGTAISIVNGTGSITIANTGVTSFNGRTGAVTPQTGDYTAAMVTGAVDIGNAYVNPSWISSLDWTKITNGLTKAPTAGANIVIPANTGIVAMTWRMNGGTSDLIRAEDSLSNAWFRVDFSGKVWCNISIATPFIALGTSTLSASGTLTINSSFWLVDTTSGVVTTTLPAPSTCVGIPLRFKKKVAANSMQFNVSGGGNHIDGLASVSYAAAMSSVTFISDGTDYYRF